MGKEFFEIPEDLKQLYPHWKYHTKKDSYNATNLYKKFDTELLNDIFTFVTERMRMWDRKNKSLFPYTDDPILQKYRFCNMYRELDRQTIEYHTLLKPLTKNFSTWLLNMYFCRLVCKPDTVKSVGLLSTHLHENKKVYENLVNHPRPMYGTAYVFPVSTIMRSDFPTREQFVCLYMPTVIEKVATYIKNQKRTPVASILKEILKITGFNHSFLWTEVLIDVAYQYPQYINLFGDFPIGPGAILTMKKIHSDNHIHVPKTLAYMYLEETSLLSFENRPVYLSAENWEGIGCEFRKYQNLGRGLGRKRKFTTT